MSGWAAAAQAVGSIIPSVLGGIFGKKSQERNFQQQIALMDYQNWYNEPRNQKKRLIDAGLNPSLMYETMPQNVSQSIPSRSESNPWGDAMMSLGRSLNLGQIVQNSINASVQNDNIRAETNLKNQAYEQNAQMNPLSVAGAGLDNTRKQTEIAQNIISNEIKALESKYLEEYLKSRNAGQKLTNENVQEQTEKIKQEVANMDTLGKIYVKQLSFMDRDQILKIDKTLAEIQNLNSSTNRNNIASKLDELERQLRSSYGLSFSDEVKLRQSIKALKDAGRSFGGKYNPSSTSNISYMTMEEYTNILREEAAKKQARAVKSMYKR